LKFETVVAAAAAVAAALFYSNKHSFFLRIGRLQAMKDSERVLFC